MKVDILLISYNQEEYIEQALEGILLQRLQPSVTARVLVADDASTDDTLKIIRSYEQKAQFPFVYLAKEPNMGHVLNYKRAFEACTGDYVAILEGDDYWCNPYHLQKHLDFLDQHRECSMSTNRPYVYLQEARHFAQTPYPAAEGDFSLTGVREQATGNRVGNLSTSVIRTNLLHTLPQWLWTVKTLDWPLEIILAESGFVARLKEPTSVYRVHNYGLWSGLQKEEKKKSDLEAIDLYDKMTEGRCHAEFNHVREYYNPHITWKKRIKNICPPLLISFVRMLIPPILLRK